MYTDFLFAVRPTFSLQIRAKKLGDRRSPNQEIDPRTTITSLHFFDLRRFEDLFKSYIYNKMASSDQVVIAQWFARQFVTREVPVSNPGKGDN